MTKLLDFNFQDLLPSSITKDERIAASATVLDSQLKAVTAAIPQVLIYSRIDEFEEPLLSLLAWQFHVDHWEPHWPLETKREAVKTSIKLHKKKGTPWAVRKAIEVATRAPAKVIEWFNYNGDPYKFKVAVTRPITDFEPVLLAVKSAKNVRSHLEAIEVPHNVEGKVYVAGVGRLGLNVTGYIYCNVQTSPTTLYAVGLARLAVPVSATLPIPQNINGDGLIYAAGLARIGNQIIGVIA
ncbi:phage tail protein I [Maridesulfovibrio ferrireducens]|uniref:phage tail protein I n=1 Tax=Maridesulfovibrio ferrireducens TaxID=246191 RepID=UPI001A1BC798|nr:phage tail protein I [Maridesulfovibrio ferrireducens]MBI9112239.1 phage tail protein I [Maridesulfovibrio ferrireducens]